MQLSIGSVRSSSHAKKAFLLWHLSLSIFIIFFASGCDLFGSNKKTEVSEVEIQIAPEAIFSLDTSSGKAALVVNFTDNSIAGTASITAWQWEFGDGGTSDQQNPQYTYLTEGEYDVRLTVTTTVGSDASNQVSTVSVIPADTVTKITVVDTRGLPLTGVIATSEVFSIEEQATNEMSQLLVSTRPSESQGVVRLQKEGYLDELLYLDSTQFNSTKPVTMLKRPPAIIFDGSFGGEFIGQDGATVTIPDAALVKADGSSVAGPVELYITPVDISDPMQLKAFPGSFYGLPDEDTIPDGEDLEQQLFSYGVVEYSFYQDGEELQLREGVTADLQLPIYATKDVSDQDLVVGGVIPLWTLNEQTGLWVQQGEGTIIANPLVDSGFSLSAVTTHFTWFNTDAWSWSSSGSGGGVNGSGSCRVTVTVVGAEIGEELTFELFNFKFVSASSLVGRTYVWDGIPMESSIPYGALVTATAKQGGKKDTANLICIDNEISATLVLEEVAPEFVDWDLTSEPVFSRDSDTSPYEITENEIRIGGFFVNTENVEIVTDLVAAEVLTLPNRRYFLAQYELTDTTPAQITATIKNDFGSDERVSSIDYINEHSPVLDYFAANITQDKSSIRYDWQVKGADSATVDYFGEDLSSVPVAVFVIDDIESGFALNNQLLGQVGFIRISFENQYGNTVVIGRLSDLGCPPGSEFCGPVN